MPSCDRRPELGGTTRRRFGYCTRGWRMWLATLGVSVVIASPGIRAQLQSPEMRALADKAGFGPAVVRWCPVDTQVGRRLYAVAVKSPAGGGRYLVLDPDGTVTPLLAYSGDVDLSCYPRERAEELSTAIKTSDTIDGQLQPRWNGTVVCAFIENTQAVCWQFDPAARRFVEVGRWRT